MTLEGFEAERLASKVGCEGRMEGRSTQERG